MDNILSKGKSLLERAQQGASNLFSSVPPKPSQNVDEKALQLLHADFHIEANGKQHRTSEYSVMNLSQDPLNQQLVARRGQEFLVDLEFDRPYVKGTDAVKLVFTLECPKLRGSYKPKHGQVSFNPADVPVQVNDKKPTDTGVGWIAYIVSVNGPKISVNVKPPAKCPIGKWDISVELSTQNNQDSRKYAFKKPIYIIFNPWCPEDDTYYSGKQEHLNVYVLGTSGIVYDGLTPSKKPRGRTWHYDQFEPDVLDCAISLTTHYCDKEQPLSITERGDVVRVIRRVTSQVNSNADEADGVLEGKWLKEGESFDGGMPPEHWQCSKDILQKYYSAKLQNPNANAAVKYGQCWVFASVVTSVCRALGIPSRSVTNYQSGHERKDNGYSFAIDKYIDGITSKPCTISLQDDSIWDFHVWAEAWMKRADVGEIYSGWQVIDATAQEKSDEIVNEGTAKQKKVEIFTMGPAPVKACYRGDVNVKYDVNFLFGEVNSDIVQWCRVDDEHYNFKSIQTEKCTGQLICTEDVERRGQAYLLTEKYKPIEGSKDAQRVKQNALEQAHLDIGRLTLSANPDIILEVNEPEENFIGNPFKFEIIVHNKSSSQKHAGTGWVQVYTAANSSIRSDLIEEFQLEFEVEPGKNKAYPFIVTYENYRNLLKVPNRTLLIEYGASVTGADITFFGQSYHYFSQPEIKIEVPKKLKEMENFKATVTFQNTLNITIPDGKFHIVADGCKIIHQKETEWQKLKKPLDPKESASVTFDLEPYRISQPNVITVDFISDSVLVFAHGSVEIHVK